MLLFSSIFGLSRQRITVSEWERGSNHTITFAQVSDGPICYRQFFNYLTSTCHHAVRTISSHIVPGARGQIIVGTHCLVSTPSKELTPSLAWLGIVLEVCRKTTFKSFTEFTRYGQLVKELLSLMIQITLQMVCGKCFLFFNKSKYNRFLSRLLLHTNSNPS